MGEPNYMSAARGEIQFDGVKLATVTGIRWQETVSRRRVQVVGELEADERTPTAIDISWSVDTVKTVKLDERQQGIMRSRKAADIIKEEPFTIVIKDKGKSPSAVMTTLVACVYNGGSWNMPAGDIVTGSINGDGKRMLLASEK